MKFIKPLLLIIFLAVTPPLPGAEQAGKTKNAPGWWEQPVRMLRVDHMPDFAEMKNEDMDALARSRKEKWGINCEWIMGALAWGGRGDLTAFETPLFERAPGFEDFDYLRRYTPAAHRHGIKVISYLNMHWYSYPFAAKHPGWEQLMSTGETYGRKNPLYGNGTTLCVNSPWRDWAFTMIREAMKTGIDGVFLDGPVVYPDCCYCESCRRRFREEYGSPIPTEDWTNPLWRKFIDFREDSLARFLSDARKAVREISPDGVIFLNAGSWSPGAWRVARDIQNVSPYQDFNGAEAFFHYTGSQNLYPYSMAGKYLRAGGKPAVVFMHYMSGAWHYLLLPPNELKSGLAQTIASGANPWLALVQSSLLSMPRGAEPAKEIFDFLEANRDYYTEMESIAETAVLFSARTGRNYISMPEIFARLKETGKPGSQWAELTKEELASLSLRKRQCEDHLALSCEGYFHALTRNHVPFDIILDQDLTREKLARYKVLALPDAACLTAEAASVIKEFVRNGGSLLASYEAGFYDDKGEASTALFETLGVREVAGAFPVSRGENYVKAVSEHWGMAKDRLVERAGQALKVRAADGVDTPSRFLEPLDRPYVPLKGVSEFPALLLHRFGKGKVAYFPEAIGVFIGESRMPSAEMRLGKAIDFLLENPVLTADLPKTVSVDAYRIKGTSRIAVHLVNNTVDGHPVSEFLPVFDVAFKIRSGAAPKSTRALRENGKIETSYRDGWTEVRLPGLTLYEVVVIDAGPAGS
ncbi:MAG: beta-galactosidase trimerization domain-containing protein [Acidobacteriota bacterium]|nr:beta-galactosidase trimerization domain-containing protein [Acidobacteriota bacterium]